MLKKTVSPADATKDVFKKNYFIEDVAWPGFAICSVWSLYKPFPPLMLLVFVAAFAILVNSVGQQRRWICILMLVNMALNSLFVLYRSHELFENPQLWMANRLLYVVGLALFAPPLIDEAKDKFKKRDVQSALIAAAFLCVFFASWVAYEEHTAKSPKRNTEVVNVASNVESDKDDVEPWYTKWNLADDFLLGLAVGFLISGITPPAKDDKNSEVL